MGQACLRCSSSLPEGVQACPQCGLNIGKIKKALGEFLPSGGLELKIQNAVAAVETNQMSPDELGHRLQVEWQLVEALLERYRNVTVPQLASAAELMVKALTLYKQSLLALGEEGNSGKSLDLAREADECLLEFDQAREQMELRYSNPEG